MEKIFRKEVVRVTAGTRFSWKDPCSDWSADLTVDENGNPIGASYGSARGWCSNCSGEDNFDSTVLEVMRTFLRDDKEEFSQMRELLNPKYKQMAENVRKAEASKYDF